MNAVAAAVLRHRKPGLQGRFMLWFGLIVITLMTAVVFVVERRMSETLMEQAEMRATAIARSIAATVKSSLLNYDYVALQQAAETAAQDENLLYVVILTKENIVAGYSGRSELQGQPSRTPPGGRGLPADALQIQQVSAAADPTISVEHLDIAIPVMVEGAPVRWGTVRVGMSLVPLRTAVGRMQVLLLVLGLGAILITLVSARLLSRQIIRPIAGLAEATGVIAAGNLDHNVSEKLVGELGDLARSFNQMTGELRRSRDDVHRHNTHLENMVQLRTAALAQKAEELERANAELTELDRLKSDFLSNVSHELRTPLTAIRSFTEILLDPEPGLADTERHEFLQIVSAQSERLTRLISDLLDLSKIEAGKFECRPVAIEARRLVDTCVHSLRTLAANKGIQLVTDLGDVPPVFADVDRMNQVLTNLIDNAIKFTPANGTVRVEALRSPTRRCLIGVEREGSLPRGAFHGMESRASENGEFVVLSVRDTGIGISAADELRVFDKFGQVGNVLTDKPQGTGLGLPISGSIAVQHGGALWVESTPGVGSVFSVSIPVAPNGARDHGTRGKSNVAPLADAGQENGVAATASAAAGGGTTRGSRSKATTGASRSFAARTTAGPASALDGPGEPSEGLVGALQRTTIGKRVLVVDDEPSIVSALTEVLQPAGYIAIGCSTGSQAVARARDLRPDAIVLDIMMPEINGYDVLRLLKSEPDTAGIPVIVLSVLDDREKAMQLGADEYVRKPFDKQVLLDNVRMLI
jgi:signal transduction histidine kinase/CheY-like chemotaxis protein